MKLPTMKPATLKGYLEIATNIAVLLVALVILIVFARNYFTKSGTSLQPGLVRGQAFSQLSKLNYRDAPQTLLIAADIRCQYCAESVPFYMALVQAQQQNKDATNIVMIFPNSEDEVNQYVQQRHLGIDTVTGIDFRGYGLVSTPTIILVDRSGKVIDFWIGKLPEDVEQQITKIVSERTQ